MQVIKPAPFQSSTIMPQATVLFSLILSEYEFQQKYRNVLYLNYERCEFLLVNCSFINCVRNRKIDHFAGRRKNIIFQQHLVFNLNKTQCTVTILTTVQFLFPVWFCVLFLKSRLCKSEVNIYVIKNVFVTNS